MAYTSTQTVTTAKTPEEVTVAAQSALTSMGMRPRTQGTKVIGTSGSNFLSLFLGFLSPEDSFPVRVTVDAGTGGTAQILAEDTYINPLALGVHGKRRRRTETLAQQTRQALEQQLA